VLFRIVEHQVPERERMTAVKAILKGFQSIFRMAGRSPRREFVPFAVLILFLLVLSQICQILLFYSFVRSHDGESDLLARFQFNSFVVPLVAALSLVLVALLFTAIVRRLHDIGYSARWALAMYLGPVLALLVPFLGTLVSYAGWPEFGPNDDLGCLTGVFAAALMLLASLGFNIFLLVRLCFRPSQPGPNRFGPNPNEVSP
jgi:uncharacterized membrane protein YhaH (DUF805 family)